MPTNIRLDSAILITCEFEPENTPFQINKCKPVDQHKPYWFNETKLDPREEAQEG